MKKVHAAQLIYRIRKFILDINREVLINILADLLKPLLILLVGIVSVLLAKFLAKKVELRVPVGLVVIVAGMWIASLLATWLIARRSRPAQKLQISDENGLLWTLGKGQVVEGPFCPECIEPLESLSSELGQSTESLLRFSQDSSYSVTKLHCSQCGSTLEFEQDLDTLKRDAEMRAKQAEKGL